MVRNAVAILAACLLAGPAVAGNGNGNNNGPDFGGNSSATATSTSTGVGVGVGVGVGKVTDSGNSNVAVDASSHNVVGQHQGQTQGQTQGQSFTNVESTVVKAEPNIPANSAADLVLASCQAGFSVQSELGGGAIASPDEVCLMFTLSQLYLSVGDEAASKELLDEARDVLKYRSNPVIRTLQGIPLLRKLF